MCTAAQGGTDLPCWGSKWLAPANHSAKNGGRYQAPGNSGLDMGTSEHRCSATGDGSTLGLGASAKQPTRSTIDADLCHLMQLVWMVPDVAQIKGNPVKIPSEDGTVLVLEFWATWCGPCVQTVPVGVWCCHWCAKGWQCHHHPWSCSAACQCPGRHQTFSGIAKAPCASYFQHQAFRHRITCHGLLACITYTHQAAAPPAPTLSQCLHVPWPLAAPDGAAAQVQG
jgi:thiol-disulfide isomerase/thioredoxin